MAVVVLQDPDPTWPTRFQELAAFVRASVGDDVVRIDHVGSTAVAGLCSKDVIDIQVTVSRLADADAWPDQIGGFRRRGNGKDHVPPGARPGPDWSKRYWSSDQPRAHLHVREVGRANQRYALLFRDYLRAHPRSAEAYERAKRSLASVCESSAVYADAKDPVCDLIIEAAEAWAATERWQPEAPVS